MPFIDNEWSALKDKLSGLTVDTPTSPALAVQVFLGVPETEFTDWTFPAIRIDPQLPVIDHDREMRGWVGVPYFPEGTNPADYPTFDPTVNVNNSPFKQFYPMPVNFDFNITVWNRTQVTMLQMAHRLNQWDMLPQRDGFLIEPVTGTVRSLFVIGGPAYDASRDVDGKRFFTINYVVRVPGEMLSSEYEALTALAGAPIGEVDINLHREADGIDYGGEVIRATGHPLTDH